VFRLASFFSNSAEFKMEHHKLAGTFWSKIDDDVYKHFLTGKDIAEEQTQSDLHILAEAGGRDTAPLYRRILLQPLTVRRMEGTEFVSCKAPAKLAALPMITDRIVNPETVWLHNIDFTLEGGEIKFRNDPFKLVEDQKPIYDEHGHILGEEITLWLVAADYDERYLCNHWGVIMDLLAPSSEEYRTLINLVYGALLGGTTSKHIEHIVATLNGIALAKGNETILEIGTDDKGLFVASDRHVYRANGAKPIVDVGTKVKNGDPLFDNFRIYHPTDDVPEAALPELTIPKNFLDQITCDLTFPNKEVPLHRKDVFAYFDVGGEKSAVENFQAVLGLCSLPDGRRLIDLLGPMETINPCKFVRQNVLRNCLLFVIRAAKTPPSLAGINQEKLLRTLVPPHETLLIVKL
jgi:hypothetical protein